MIRNAARAFRPGFAVGILRVFCNGMCTAKNDSKLMMKKLAEWEGCPDEPDCLSHYNKCPLVRAARFCCVTRACSLRFLLFSLCGRSWVIWISLIPRLMGWRSTALGIQCWNRSFMRMLGFALKHSSMKRNWGELHSRAILPLTSYATKVRPAVLNGAPWGTIAPALAHTRRSDPLV